MNILCNNLQKLILNEFSLNRIVKCKNCIQNKQLLNLLLDLQYKTDPYLISSIGNSDILDIWYTNSEKEKYFEIDSYIMGMVRLDDDKFIIGSLLGDIYQLCITENELTWLFKTDRNITSLCLIDIDSLITYSGNIFKVWSLSRGESLKECNEEYPITNIASYKSRLFVNVDGIIKLYNFYNNEEDYKPKIFQGISKAQCLLVFNDDILITGNSDLSLSTWSIDTADLITTFQGHTKSIKNLVKIDDNTFLSLSLDETIIRWNIYGQTISIFTGLDKYNNMAVLINNSTLITSSISDKFQQWNLKTFKAIDIPLRENSSIFIRIDDNTICFADSKRLYIRNIYERERFVRAKGFIKHILKIDAINYAVCSEGIAGLHIQVFNKNIRRYTKNLNFKIEYNNVHVKGNKIFVIDSFKGKCYIYDLNTNKYTQDVNLPAYYIRSTYLLDENLLMILASNSVVFNLNSKTIENRLNFLAQRFWDINTGDGTSEEGVFYYYCYQARVKIYNINNSRYLIQQRNRYLLTDLKSCLKTIHLDHTSCVSVSSNYIFIGGHNLLIILDLDLNVICTYEISDNVKKLIDVGMKRVVTLSDEYLSIYDSDNFNCIYYEDYVNENGVIAYLDSDK
jgi:hypothetical protein